MIDLKGKVAVVFGLANKRSIAYGIAQKLAQAGATLAICYQSERLKREADTLIDELNAELGSTGLRAISLQCDVTQDTEIEAVFSQLKETFGTIHTVVHAVAFAPADAIKNDFLLTTRDDFRIAHDVSVYSLIAVSRAAVPLMTEGGSIITLTYYGSTKVFPNYNVMGVAKAALEATVRYLAASLGAKNIRVNAISAGPIKTLAARGIGDFTKILTAVEERAPLHRNVDQLEVGGAALFLASDLASGITGEITFVDCGYNITGL
jgi:enoyl-[acyl-carrier protein] reductase I